MMMERDAKRIKKIREVILSAHRLALKEGRNSDKSQAARAYESLDRVEASLKAIRRRVKRLASSYRKLDIEHRFLTRKYGVALSTLDQIELVLSGQTMYKSKEEQIETSRYLIKTAQAGIAAADQEQAKQNPEGQSEEEEQEAEDQEDEF